MIARRLIDVLDAVTVDSATEGRVSHGLAIACSPGRVREPWVDAARARKPAYAGDRNWRVRLDPRGYRASRARYIIAQLERSAPCPTRLH